MQCTPERFHSSSVEFTIFGPETDSDNPLIPYPINSQIARDSNDRLVPLGPKLEILLLAEKHQLKWGFWFLAICRPTSSSNWDSHLSCIDGDEFYCSLAEYLEINTTIDTSLASHLPWSRWDYNPNF